MVLYVLLKKTYRYPKRYIFRWSFLSHQVKTNICFFDQVDVLSVSNSKMRKEYRNRFKITTQSLPQAITRYSIYKGYKEGYSPKGRIIYKVSQNDPITED